MRSRVRQDKPAELPIIGFDLNGVLAEANEPLCLDIRARWGLSIDPAGLTTYGELGHRLAEYAPNPRAAQQWLREHINSPEFILKLQPIAGAQELFRTLTLDKRIVSGHAQAYETVVATRRWCAIHGFPEQIDFTKYKDSWCRQTKAQFLVEDSPLHAMEASAAGTHVFLLDKPYNTLCEGQDITRITSLLDIVSEVSKMAARGSHVAL